jgi:glycosyltransferase involved in cell wall biosynthesis
VRPLEVAAAALLRPQLAIFHRFESAPYGGSNQFLQALRRELRRQGLRVSANLIGGSTRACLLNAFAFDVARLRRQRRSGCRIVQRVDGPVGAYRGTDREIDELVFRLNQEFADATVFQSRYSLDAQRALGFEFKEPVVIMNAVDPSIFHARERVDWSLSRPVRLIASSWSDNPRKGGPTLKWLEDHLDWDRFTLTFVGRTRVTFRRVRVVPPLPSQRLGALLRGHDIYLAPSWDDPCSNALIEALACGLPAIYRRSGGHPEIVGEAGQGFEEDAEILEILGHLVDQYRSRQALIRLDSIRDVARRYRDVLGV